MATGAGGLGPKINWRVVGWGLAAVLLALPFLTGAPWTLLDYLFMAGLFGFVGAIFEVAVRRSTSAHYRGGVALALLGAFLVTWVNLAVGIVGSEDNPANRLFFGALVVGLAGAGIARFRARGLAVSMIATAIALAAAFAAAITVPTDEPHVPHLRELAGTSLIATLFLGSAWLFRRAASDR